MVWQYTVWYQWATPVEHESDVNSVRSGYPTMAIHPPSLYLLLHTLLHTPLSTLDGAPDEFPEYCLGRHLPSLQTIHDDRERALS